MNDFHAFKCAACNPTTSFIHSTHLGFFLHFQETGVNVHPSIRFDGFIFVKKEFYEKCRFWRTWAFNSLFLFSHLWESFTLLTPAWRNKTVHNSMVASSSPWELLTASSETRKCVRSILNDCELIPESFGKAFQKSDEYDDVCSSQINFFCWHRRASYE